MIQERHISVWNNCLNFIQQNIDPKQFSVWFRPIKPVSLTESTLTLEVPSEFFREYLEDAYLDILKASLKKELGVAAKLVYVVAPVQKQNTPVAVAEQPGRPVFKVQLFALDRCLSEGNKSFKGLKGVAYYKEGNLYKYTYGSSTSIAEVRKMQREIAAKFPSAFVVAFVDGKRVDLQTAIKLSQNK